MLGHALWSLRRFGRNPGLHALAKRTMRVPFPNDSVRRVPFGPLKGSRWLCRNEHQFWMPLGLYEGETATWLQMNVGQGTTLLDIGANAGYFTLLGASLVGDAGRVFAFEPVPSNAVIVRKQLALNGIDNAEVVELALCDAVGTAVFEISSVNANSHLAETEAPHTSARSAESVEVVTSTLDAWCTDTGVVPDVVKIDVEGAESLVFEGAAKTLRVHRPRVLVSTHSEALNRACRGQLESAGYDVLPLCGFEHELIGYPRH